MRFELFIATRYLRAKRRQAFIGVITGISVAGVAAGVASLIVALAINNGFRQDLQQRLLGSTAHVSLLRVQSDGIQDWRPLLDKLSKQPHVVAVAPAIYEQVLISRGPRARGAVLKGMIPRYERRVSDLLKTVTLGSAAALEEGSGREPSPVLPHATSKSNSQANSTTTATDKSVHPAQSPDDLAGVQQRIAAMPPIILGKDMAEQVGASVGSVVLVTSPQGELTPFGMVPKYLRFKVVGIFNSGFFNYDSSWAFTRLSDAQRLFGLGDLISVVEFKLDDIYAATDVARQLEQAAGHVVDDRRSRRDRGACDHRLGGVDRDRGAGGGELADDRDHAAQLFVGGDRLGARVGRLATHVEDVGARRPQREAVRDRGVGGKELAAVGE